MQSVETLTTDSSSSSISSSLLYRVRAGDSEAWKQMVYIYGPVIFNWCRDGGISEHSAADIGQEVFYAVAAGISRFRREKQSDTFTGWLRSITRNKIADYRRRQQADPQSVGSGIHSLASEPPDHSPSEDSEQQEKAQSVRAVLFHRALQIMKTQFAENTWRAFWATAIDGRQAKEVAEDLGMTPVAVRKAKSRVLHRLRSEFEAEDLK